MQAQQHSQENTSSSIQESRGQMLSTQHLPNPSLTHPQFQKQAKTSSIHTTMWPHPHACTTATMVTPTAEVPLTARPRAPAVDTFDLTHSMAPLPPPGTGASVDAKMDFLHQQLDSFGLDTEVLGGLVLLGNGVQERLQGGSHLPAALSLQYCPCIKKAVMFCDHGTC